MLGWLNLPLFLGGSPASDFSFLPGRFAEGEWWRLLTHPLVHISWYHLLLDASAFLLLYAELRNQSLGARWFMVGCSGGGALLACLWWAPQIGEIGLCGLSGVAHGLMAVVALDSMAMGRKRGKQRWWFGVISLGLLLIKCAWEVATGTAFLEILHFGMVGTPLVICHAGGVVGGLIAFGLAHLFQAGVDPARIQGYSSAQS